VELKAFWEGLPYFGNIASCTPATGLQVTITSPMYTFSPFLLSVALLAWLEEHFTYCWALSVVKRARYCALRFNRVVLFCN
jgi:hypothetical protein